jgi:hypothetical protein
MRPQEKGPDAASTEPSTLLSPCCAHVKAPPANCERRAASSQAKRFATLRARCALIGIELYESTTDNGRPLFIAWKWAMPPRRLETLDALAAWIARVDGHSE